MSVEVLGRVAGESLQTLQVEFTKLLQRTLDGEGYTEEYLISCSGFVLRTNIGDDIRVCRSVLTEKTIIFEVYPAKGSVGVMYFLSVPASVDDETLLAVFQKTASTIA